MRNLIRLAGLAAALAMTATAAQAQGKSQGKAHRGKGNDEVVVRRADGEVIPGNGRQVPPGLAKKPGQMPPGQYKKVYGTADGASVLSDVFRRNGYTIVRVAPAGSSRYVYYRLRNGSVHRAVVRPGTAQLSFSNVPSTILQEVLSRLY